MLNPSKPSAMHRSRRVQRGAVLVIALIFLLLLTILAISASGRSLLQERMAGGLHNAQQADMGAQTALRGAEWKLWTSTSNVTSHLNCGTGIFTDCYVYDPAKPITNVQNFRTKPGWVTAGSTEYKGYGSGVDFTSFASYHRNRRSRGEPALHHRGSRHGAASRSERQSARDRHHRLSPVAVRQRPPVTSTALRRAPPAPAPIPCACLKARLPPRAIEPEYPGHAQVSSPFSSAASRVRWPCR